MRVIARSITLVFSIGAVTLIMGQGCPSPSQPAPSGPVFNNTTDPTNAGATYIGSQACQACHPNIAQLQTLHGHAHMLNRIQGVPPSYPPQASRAGVSNPPAGLTWNDISYVIGGYLHKANFIDQQGFFVTDGFNHVNSQFNLTFPGNGTTAAYVPFEAGNTARKPYDYSCFVCHSTGPTPQDANNPVSQENRPGITGTWREPGVQCEACHGPGSNHIPNPQARNIFVDNSARFCGQCHTRQFQGDASVIAGTGDGFIADYQQYPELLASGGHSGFGCNDCHNPHASANYDPANAMINQCTSCHPDKTLGFHAGKQYARGDYVETLACVSCHMPLASKSGSSIVLGQAKGRVADVRTHIFRISTDPVDYTSFFTPDLTQVRKDDQGRATLTVDFVCLRCHNTENGFPFALTIKSASEIAAGIHKFTQ